MRSTRNLTSTARLTAAAIVGFAALPLSGCLYASIPSEPTVIEESVAPAPTTEAPTDEEPDSGTLPATLSFADGASLPIDTYIEWGDGLVIDDGWELTSPDTGAGTWGYTSADGTCTAAFWQGNLDGLTPTGDDSVDSDAVIAFFLEADVADVTANAADTELSYQIGGAGGVQARSVVGEQAGGSWTLISRAFGTLGVGVYTLVDCSGGDIEATVAEVVEKNAVLAY